MHRFKHVTHPHNVLLVVRRLAPTPDDFEEERCGPVSDGRLIVADATHGAAERLDGKQRPWGGPYGAATHDRFNGLIGETIEVWTARNRTVGMPLAQN